jgi:hypothetical protein
MLKELKKTIGFIGGLHKETYLGKSFYPNQKPISKTQKIFRQFLQIWRNGQVEHFFLLYGMDVRSAEECKSYVNSGAFAIRRDFLNYKNHNHPSTALLRNKLYFGMFADALGIATPPNFGYINESSQLYLVQAHRFTDIEEICRHGDHDFFCKEMTGECAEGLLRFKVQNGQIIYKEKVISINELKALTQGQSFLLQDKIQQHPAMTAMHPNSINTLRLITVRSLKDRKIYIFPSIMRMGRGNSEVDNTTVGGVSAGVDFEHNRLYAKGVIKTEHRFVAEHPDTHVVFSQFEIPFLQEAVDQAIFMHSMLEDVHSIGWDVCITENGPLFIEGNDNWEISTCQALYGGLNVLFQEYFYK